MHNLAMIRFIAATALALWTAQEPSGRLRIDAVAVDRNGAPVADLAPQDLEVWISGRRIPIESVTAATAATRERDARLIVILLDDVTIDPAMVIRVRDAARRLVTRLRAGDRMAVARLSGAPLEVTSDPARLQRRIESFNQAGGVIPLDRIGAHLLTTVAAVSREMNEAPERRKAIVAIGSGWLLDTPIPPPQVGPEVRREWTDAVRALAIADATYYVIDPAGVGSSRVGTGKGGFARESGGHAFINTNDVDAAIARILGEVDTYYEILVADPPFGRTGPLRELDVRSRRQDVTVRARRWLPGGR